jgi:hypothetical protein
MGELIQMRLYTKDAKKAKAETLGSGDAYSRQLIPYSCIASRSANGGNGRGAGPV